MFLIMINFKKNMNTFTTSMRLLINNKVMIIIDKMKLVHKLIKKRITIIYHITENY